MHAQLGADLVAFLLVALSDGKTQKLGRLFCPRRRGTVPHELRAAATEKLHQGLEIIVHLITWMGTFGGIPINCKVLEQTPRLGRKFCGMPIYSGKSAALTRPT